MKTNVKKLVLAAVCLSLCWVLPFFTGNNYQLGNMLSLMHIPAILCGFICGGPLGAVVGFIAPITRHFLFQGPPLQTALAMMFELSAYGLVSGLLYAKLPKKIGWLYIDLVAAILAGRIIGSAVKFIIAGISHTTLGFGEVMTAMMVTTLPGTAIQLVIIPIIVIALRKAGLFANEKSL
ncbi:MAG: ECF transporter S component [Clostridia bacterium]|nr:ECF transporter S component [Oscillospiraceae bacterium]MBQ1955069.1 ECF transporter S component [Clostridia bacterium]